VAIVRTAAFILGLVGVVLGSLAFWYAAGGHLTTNEIGILAPVATFTAAYVALRVATRDRRDRTQERSRAALGQARLVLIETRVASENRLAINVDNFGREPIRDVELVSVDLHTNSGVFRLGLPATARVSVITRREWRFSGAYREGDWTIGDLRNDDGVLWLGADRPFHTEVMIKFDDADGQRWLGSIHGEPRHEIPTPPNPSWLKGRWRRWKAQRAWRLQRFGRRPPYWLVFVAYGTAYVIYRFVYVADSVRYWLAQVNDYLEGRH
jgi:hypothetical protein